MDMAGVIFADTYDVELDQLTEKRNLAAVPFGSRYRLIDFALSNLANSGVRNIGIITSINYQSMMSHVRGGMDWDLERKRSGLSVLPPFATMGAGDVYHNRLHALEANLNFLRNLEEKYVILCSCNYVANINYRKMLDFHIRTGARLTILTSSRLRFNQKGVRCGCMRANDDGRVTDVAVTKDLEPGWDLSMNTFIMEREDLVELLYDAIRTGKESFRRDIADKLAQTDRVMEYRAEEETLLIDSLQGYFQANLALLDGETRRGLFASENGAIITKVHDSWPTKYGDQAKVENSLIADGVLVEGTVRNSILFRGVHIAEGATVENSIIFQNATVSEGARLNYVLADKNVFVEPDRILSGYITHPFFLERNTRI